MSGVPFRTISLFHYDAVVKLQDGKQPMAVS